MACSHVDCQCEIEGCGLTHPKNWQPTMTVQINMTVVSGDDPADCFAHYLLQMGYPRDRPDHLRKVSESMAARREGKKDAQRASTQRR